MNNESSNNLNWMPTRSCMKTCEPFLVLTRSSNSTTMWVSAKLDSMNSSGLRNTNLIPARVTSRGKVER